MPIAAVIGGVAALGGAAIGAIGANKAADKQEKAANKATKTQLQMYEQTRTDLAPFREVGREGLFSLADLYGLPTSRNPQGGQAFNEASLEAFRRSPDYQVALREGVRGIDQSNAARGLLLSGKQVKDVTGFASDLASLKFNSYMDRLAQLAGMGGNAAAQTGNAAISTGRGVASTQLGAGEAQAAGIVGQTNAINTGLSDFARTLAFQSMMGSGGGSAYGGVGQGNSVSVGGLY